MRVFITIISICFSLNLFGQETLEDSITSTQDKNTIDKGKFEVHALLQFQWQNNFKADSITSLSSTGGYFSRNESNKFAIRRGRVRLGYSNSIVDIGMQVDLTERGLFINDFYTKLKDKWLDVFSITGGLFTKPYGYEIGYETSSERLFLERTLLAQTLFPNIRDLGAQLEIKGPNKSKLKGLNLKIAAFNGNQGKSETDKYKDFVAGLRYDSKKMTKKELLSFSLGVSGLYGGVQHVYDIGSNDPQGQKYIYKMTDNGGYPHFDVDSARTISSGRYGGLVKKHYINSNFRVNFFHKLGTTSLLGEYNFGTQISKEINAVNPYTYSTFSPSGNQMGVIWSFFNAPNSYNPAIIKSIDVPANTYIRKFSGGYIGFIHQFTKPKLFLTFRYEWYDPNTSVKGRDIKISNDQDNTSTQLSPADVKFSSYQIGIGADIAENIRISAQYDLVRNESTSISPISFNNDLINAQFIYPNAGWENDIKDDVLSLRLQVKF